MTTIAGRGHSVAGGSAARGRAAGVSAAGVSAAGGSTGARTESTCLFRAPWRTLVVPCLTVGSLLLGPTAHVSGQTAEQRYFDWARMPFPTLELQARRAALIRELSETGGGVFLTASAEGRSQGETFRQSDDFWYLTGLEVPRSVLALDAETGAVTLFAPARDPRFESASRPNDFPGRPIADDPQLAERSGIDRVRSIEELGDALRRWIEAGRTLRVNPGGSRSVPLPSVDDPWDPLPPFVRYLRSRAGDATITSAHTAVARVRSIKSSAEIAIMRRVANLTADAIREAARSVRPNVDERSLEAEFERACKRGGAQRTAFASIVKSGPNALWPWRILAAHYDRRNRRVEEGDLVIFDVGCELDYYVSDVGRTFPVSGRFRPEQKEALRTSTRVADAIIESVRPGVTLAELQAIAERSIPDSVRGFMQTGLFFGHPLGLSTGDPVLTEEPLRPGMVFTVEPWYYDHQRGISVFIEDEVLVTETGAEVLTGALPRTPEGLEQLVARARSPGSGR